MPNKRKAAACDSPVLCSMMAAAGLEASSSLARPASHDHLIATPLGRTGSWKTFRGVEDSVLSTTSSPFDDPSTADEDSFNRRRRDASDSSTFTSRRNWSLHHRDPNDTDSASERAVEHSGALWSVLPPSGAIPPPPQHRANMMAASSRDAGGGARTTDATAEVLGIVGTHGRQRAAGLAGLSALSRRR